MYLAEGESTLILEGGQQAAPRPKSRLQGVAPGSQRDEKTPKEEPKSHPHSPKYHVKVKTVQANLGPGAKRQSR